MNADLYKHYMALQSARTPEGCHHKLSEVFPTITNKEVPTMSFKEAVKIETNVTLIDGIRADNVSDENLIAAIRSNEAQLGELESLTKTIAEAKGDSSFIAGKRTIIQANIKAIAAILAERGAA